MKNNKGITLIALVVTIIVLLILAGVAIAMLTGNNSILSRAQSTKAYSAIGAAKDEISTAYNAAFAEYMRQQYDDAIPATGTGAKVTVLEAFAKEMFTSSDSKAHGCDITYTSGSSSVTVSMDIDGKMRYSTTANITGTGTDSALTWTAITETPISGSGS